MISVNICCKNENSRIASLEVTNLFTEPFNERFAVIKMSIRSSEDVFVVEWLLLDVYNLYRKLESLGRPFPVMRIWFS